LDPPSLRYGAAGWAGLGWGLQLADERMGFFFKNFVLINLKTKPKLGLPMASRQSSLRLGCLAGRSAAAGVFHSRGPYGYGVRALH